jgi:hypothetical protein
MHASQHVYLFVLDAGLHRKSRKSLKSFDKPCKEIETNFNFCLPWDEFSKFLLTDHSKGRLTGLWTKAFYYHFHKKFPSCAIVFSGNRVRNLSSQKRNARIWFAKSACKVEGCINACFSIQDLPKPGLEVTVTVDFTGRRIHDASAAEIDYEKGIEVATVNVRRTLSGTERAKTVDTLKLLRTESKTLYLKKLSAMNSDELAAGNNGMSNAASHQASTVRDVCQTTPVTRRFPEIGHPERMLGRSIERRYHKRFHSKSVSYTVLRNTLHQTAGRNLCV